MKYDTVVWRNTENDAVRSLGVRTVETSLQNVELARLLSVSGAATKSNLTKFLFASQKKKLFCHWNCRTAEYRAAINHLCPIHYRRASVGSRCLY